LRHGGCPPLCPFPRHPAGGRFSPEPALRRSGAIWIRGTRKPGPMDVYLPIAELSLNVFALLGLGAGVGIVTGVFGLGGGFLLTPMLIFIGVPAGVAVASSANQLAGASLSGVISYWRRGAV